MKKLCTMSCVAVLVLAMSGLSFAASMKGKGGAQASIPETNPILVELATGETPEEPGLVDNPAFTASLNALALPTTGDLEGLGAQGDSLGESQNESPQAAIQQPQPNAVPEPTTLLLMGMGLLGLAGVYRTRR